MSEIVTSRTRRRGIGLLAALALLVACRDGGGGDYFGQGPDGGVDEDSGVDVGPRPDGGGGGDDGGTLTPAPEVDPGCVDGRYEEALPSADVGLDDLISGYSTADPLSFILASLDRRYPLGSYIIASALEDTRFGNCVEMFLRPSSSAVDVLQQMSVLVHECGHLLDISESGFYDSGYVVTETVRFQCTGGDTTDRGGVTFARSLITGDAYADDRPPCGGSSGSGCDFYADDYLDGDPTDGVFDSGDQGFNFLLEEVLQYVNSLAAGYAFAGFLDYSVSERDGLLTFMWYLERYLAMARGGYFEAYALLRDDPCWREAILTVWGRAWLYLTLTEGISALGLEDDALLSLVRTPELLQEIELLRDAQGC